MNWTGHIQFGCPQRLVSTSLNHYFTVNKFYYKINISLPAGAHSGVVAQVISIAPYKQWLTGRVGVPCDHHMAGILVWRKKTNLLVEKIRNIVVVVLAVASLPCGCQGSLLHYCCWLHRHPGSLLCHHGQPELQLLLCWVIAVSSSWVIFIVALSCWSSPWVVLWCCCAVVM